MARLLIAGEWYDEVSGQGVYETDFARLVFAHAKAIFPSFHAAKFTPIVVSEDGLQARPDMVLVSHDYGEWWVVEIEMSHHSLSGHVLPQVRTLANGIYNVTHARAICRSLPHLNLNLIHEMMRGQQPRVLVVVNSPVPDWATRLAYHDAEIALIEVFHSVVGDYVLRVNGYRPERRSSILCECTFDPFFPKFLRVESPGALPFRDGETATISFETRSGQWKRVDSQDTVWLVPLGPNPLPHRCKFELKNSDSGLLFHAHKLR